jgi:hypothetical protein
MRFLRFAVVGLAAAAVLVGAWIVGGNALATWRERAVDHAFEVTFGPRATFEAKYPGVVGNVDAKEAEDLARAVGYDLAPQHGRTTASGSSIPESERAAVFEYVAAQEGRADGVVELPPPVVAAVLSSRRAALAALEDALAAGETPRWPWDPHVDPEERMGVNGAGHIQLQRLLISDALASVARGENAAAARAMEASWKLNEGLTPRPEVVAQLVSIAVASYETGALRKIDLPEDVWTPRLTAMGSRARLVDAFVLDRRLPFDVHLAYWRLHPAAGGWWGHNLVAALEEPWERLAEANYGEAWWYGLAAMRDEPAFRDAPSAPPPGRDPTGLLIAPVTNLRSSFERADRLALDAELTGKVLRARTAQAATGAWPQPSLEIAASRFPGLAWNYTVDGDAMKIVLNRELPPSKNRLVLPTSFLSRAPVH